MTYQATVTYNRTIIKKAVGHFWFRFIAWHGFLAIFICFIGCAGLLLAGDRSWKVGALGAVGVMLATTATAVYVVHLRRSLWKFKRMPSKSVQFSFTEKGLAIASDLGNSETSWQAIRQVWRFPQVWLLFFGKTIYVMLPIAEIDQATQDYVVERIKLHGGRIA